MPTSGSRITSPPTETRRYSTCLARSPPRPRRRVRRRAVDRLPPIRPMGVALRPWWPTSAQTRLGRSLGRIQPRGGARHCRETNWSCSWMQTRRRSMPPVLWYAWATATQQQASAAIQDATKNAIEIQMRARLAADAMTIAEELLPPEIPIPSRMVSGAMTIGPVSKAPS